MRLRILCGLALAPSAKDSQQSAVSSQAALQPRRVLDSTKTTSRTVKLVCIRARNSYRFTLAPHSSAHHSKLRRYIVEGPSCTPPQNSVSVKQTPSVLLSERKGKRESKGVEGSISPPTPPPHSRCVSLRPPPC